MNQSFDPRDASSPITGASSPQGQAPASPQAGAILFEAHSADQTKSATASGGRHRQELLKHVNDGATNSQDATSSDVNDYLKKITGKDITAKDFRTSTGTVFAALAPQYNSHKQLFAVDGTATPPSSVRIRSRLLFK